MEKAAINFHMVPGWWRKYFAASTVATGTEIRPEIAKRPERPMAFFQRTMVLLRLVKVRLPRSTRGPSRSSNQANHHLPKCQIPQTPATAPKDVVDHASHQDMPRATIKEGVTTNLITAMNAHHKSSSSSMAIR